MSRHRDTNHSQFAGTHYEGLPTFQKLVVPVIRQLLRGGGSSRNPPFHLVAYQPHAAGGYRPVSPLSADAIVHRGDHVDAQQLQDVTIAFNIPA